MTELSRVEWVVGIYYSTDIVNYALTWSIFCLVCVGGRSVMNLMVSVGVSLVVPSMTLIASFCTLSSFNRIVWAICIMPCP